MSMDDDDGGNSTGNGRDRRGP